MAEHFISRRSMLVRTAGIAGAASLFALPAQAEEIEKVVKNGRIKQSACGGAFRNTGLDMDGRAALAKKLGLVGLDLVKSQDWETLKKHGLVATMVSGAGSIKDGLNNTGKHPQFLEDFKKNIKAASDAGWPNVITMAGDRSQCSDEEGLDNCEIILKEAVKIADDFNVTICMELLNSKVNHPGYMCDNTTWGFELCKRVDSPRFKLLYDIYHMQIMEGDLIRTITENIQHIGHFHTAGNPGRHELGEDQEIYYPAIMRAIVKTGYDGYVAHEYSPVHDPIPSLKQAITTCDV